MITWLLCERILSQDNQSLNSFPVLDPNNIRYGQLCMSRAWLSLLELLLVGRVGFFSLASRGYSLNIAPDSRLNLTEAEPIQLRVSQYGSLTYTNTLPNSIIPMC
jgi:hypothetical protein